MAIERRKPVDRDSLVYLTEAAKVEFALELGACLAKLDMSQQELADRVGVKAPYLTRVLRGDENLTIATMVKLCHAVSRRLNFHLSERDCHVRWLEVLKQSDQAKVNAQRGGDWKRFGHKGLDVENIGAANDHEAEPLAA